MTPINWLREDVIRVVHRAQIAEHGGLPGLRSDDGLASALARPRNLYAYDEGASIFRLAAAYSYGISHNHPFADGNKRVAFMAAYVFLSANGWRLIVPEVEVVPVYFDLAAGTLTEAELAIWLEQNARPL